ncbi:AAA family ATPase [Halorubrum sp. AD140]|uniref:AAA family ATPase n=1 Tax=Halorubrum sp. AD140 TaxID=3050073 RepID=UPI002ACC63DF|nr:AAA family ATPase [Halorubrum sp. AD140]MDZ5812409.1 AAA family ATPase [Halorubrum sp. AD140]
MADEATSADAQIQLDFDDGEGERHDIGNAWHFGFIDDQWWDLFRQQGSISLGWPDIEFDVSETEGYDELKERSNLDSAQKSPNDAVEQVRRFAHDLQVGDIIFAKDGKRGQGDDGWTGNGQILAVGVITSEYVYQPADEWYDEMPESHAHTSNKHHRSVDWILDLENSERGPFRPFVKLQQWTLHGVDYDALKTQILNHYDADKAFAELESISSDYRASGPVNNASQQSVWIEKSYHNRSDRDVSGWGLGEALWCPQTTGSGASSVHYELVTNVAEGDLILHLDQNTREITGVSVAADSYEETTCLEGTRWDDQGVEDMEFERGGRPAYKVPLERYEEFEDALDVNTFLRESNRDLLDEIRDEHTVVYDTNLDLNQGAYLTEVPEEFARLINDTLSDEIGQPIPYLNLSHRTYVPKTRESTLSYEKMGDGVGSLQFEIPDELYFEDSDEIRRQIEATINSGKNIIFTGPPGTGKTELATALGETAREFDQVHDTTFTTATADWTAFDTIGGHMPETNGGDGIAFQPRIFLRCFRNESGITNEWLIIDEINRADIDKAFGQLFSVLSGDSVELPYEYQGEDVEIRWVEDTAGLAAIEDNESIFPVTPSWRLIATMNTYDKASLYEMSYAFMRRFNFIHIAVPTLEEDGTVVTRHLNPDAGENFAEAWEFEGLLAEDDLYKQVSTLWFKINQHRKIGPSIVKDMLEYVAAYDTGRRQEALTNALVSLLLPQMEGMRPETQKELIVSFGDSEETADEDSVTPDVDVEALKRRVEDFFDIEFADDD